MKVNFTVYLDGDAELCERPIIPDEIREVPAFCMNRCQRGCMVYSISFVRRIQFIFDIYLQLAAIQGNFQSCALQCIGATYNSNKRDDYGFRPVTLYARTKILLFKRLVIVINYLAGDLQTCTIRNKSMRNNLFPTWYTIKRSGKELSMGKDLINLDKSKAIYIVLKAALSSPSSVAAL